jgi:lipopolysaccharide/colanic/teichoic acid biosynthesis glycosyltransferase
MVGMLMVVLQLPVLLFAWMVVASRGKRPILVRQETLTMPRSNYLRFNVDGDDWMSRLVRDLGLDLGPVLFEVVKGRHNLAEASRLMNQIAKDRRRSNDCG